MNSRFKRQPDASQKKDRFIAYFNTQAVQTMGSTSYKRNNDKPYYEIY